MSVINWQEHAEAIISRLKDGVDGIATVITIKVDETGTAPVTMPCAEVVMAETKYSDAGNLHLNAEVTWQVLIRCQRYLGQTGALMVASAAVEAIAGMVVGIGWSPLAPVSAKFFPEALRPEPAYVLTFTTAADQLPLLTITC